MSDQVPGICPKCGGEQFIESWNENGEERAEWLCCLDPATGDANDCDGNETEPWCF